MRKAPTFAIVTAMAMAIAGCSGSNLGGSGSSESDDFPSKDITIVVPYAAGGGTDTVARALANAVQQYLPNEPSVVVTNKVGASSTVGISSVAEAEPDGYTLAAVTSTGMAIQTHLPETPYDWDDLQPVMRAVSSPQVLIVKDDAPWQTLEEWVSYAEKNPGKFKYATSGNPGTASVALAALSAAAEVETTNIPFDGAAPSMTALLGGHVDGAVMQSFEAMPQMEAGKVRALTNLGSDPIPGYEDLALAEDLYPGVTFDVFTGISAPEGISDEKLKTLDEAFKEALNDPAVIKQLANIGVEPAYAGPDEFSKIIKRDYDAIGKVLDNLKDK